MKKMLSLLLSLALLAGLCVPASAGFRKVNDYVPGQFDDVPADSWCAGAVQTVYEYGIMNGKSDTRFDTDGQLTIAHALAMACRLHSGYYGKDADFSGGEPWYQPYVDYALKNKILANGYDRYDVPISRAAFAVITGAALPDKALPEVSSIEDGAIPDVSEDADYADAVYRLYRAGVLTGNDKQGTFTPFSKITRGAAAAIVGRMADPDLRKEITLERAPFQPVPMDQLANLKSLRKKMTDAEFTEAYNAAVELVTPFAEESREDQLYGIAVALRKMFEDGMGYSTDSPHYNDAYGYFVLGVASCAGCTRATGLCLNVLGIPYEHVNENQWSHQWCRVPMDDGSYWICDAYGLTCGPEPAPYAHPYF